MHIQHIHAILTNWLNLICTLTLTLTHSYIKFIFHNTLKY